VLRRALLAIKQPGHGWRERSFKSEREAWAFIVTLDADVEVRFIDTTSQGYGHALDLLAKLRPEGSAT
jgi:hypothetical protein